MITGAIIFGVGVLVGLLAPVGIEKLRELIKTA
jgi:hypothetical protein